MRPTAGRTGVALRCVSDEMLLSDLELRRRWRLPDTFCRPYGSERGSAAHQGGDQLYLWGKGTDGELGCNLLKNQYTPIEVINACILTTDIPRMERETERRHFPCCAGQIDRIDP